MAAEPHRRLTTDETRRVYNRIGRVQDWQGFYEHRPVDELVAHADFGSATSVFELGCGTGSFAARLLGEELGPDATYVGVDLSDTMVRLATDAIAPWSDRAQVVQVDGKPPLPGDDGSCDRLVAAYVLDVLDDATLAGMLDEAHRLLAPGGWLCLTALTEGTTGPSQALIGAWRGVYRVAPSIVGGCSPLRLDTVLDARWEVRHHATIVSWLVPSEILIARPRP